MKQDMQLHLRKQVRSLIQVCQDYSFVEYPSQVIRRISSVEMASYSLYQTYRSPTEGF
jgi:hypothetical protein